MEAVRFCRRQKFDLIHVHWPFPHAIWGYVAGRLSGTPMVVTFHGAEVILCKKFFFVKYFLRHAVRNARAVLCNSSFTAGEIAKLGCDKPVHVIPFGTTVAARSTPRDASRSTKRVLFAGRLIRRKGVDYLLRAVPRVAAAVPVHVDIVGIGDQDESLRSLAEELGVTDRVTFHGFVSNEELERRYAEADVFVLPAIVDDRGDTEGLGVVLVEA